MQNWDCTASVYSPAAVDELLNYPHSVGKDWNMFKKEGENAI